MQSQIFSIKYSEYTYTVHSIYINKCKTYLNENETFSDFFFVAEYLILNEL